MQVSRAPVFAEPNAKILAAPARGWPRAPSAVRNREAWRRPRADDLVVRERLLEILKCRPDLAIAMPRIWINGPLDNSTAELLASIVGVSLVRTNRPDYLHVPPHSTP
jgi:hypothetical protein